MLACTIGKETRISVRTGLSEIFVSFGDVKHFNLFKRLVTMLIRVISELHYAQPGDVVCTVVGWQIGEACAGSK